MLLPRQQQQPATENGSVLVAVAATTVADIAESKLDNEEDIFEKRSTAYKNIGHNVKIASGVFEDLEITIDEIISGHRDSLNRSETSIVGVTSGKTARPISKAIAPETNDSLFTVEVLSTVALTPTHSPYSGGRSSSNSEAKKDIDMDKELEYGTAPVTATVKHFRVSGKRIEKASFTSAVTIRSIFA